MSGELAKLVIIPFKDKNFTDEIKSARFTAPINPESFIKNYKVEHDSKTAAGSSGTTPKFTLTGPQELKLEFILDGTGTMQGYVEVKKPDDKELYLSVHDQLDAFLKCVYDFDSEMHSPRFLIVFWGSEIKFPCVLTNLDVNHTLFDPQGFPVRVRLNATFMGYLTPESRVALTNIHSPDLTHFRKVKQGDRLDLMTFNIYKNPKYFLQVGKVNELGRIRNISPGSDLYFPPFDKNEV